MSVVMWVLVAVLAGLLAGFVMKRGSYGRGWDIALGLIGSVVVSWIFQSQWVSPDPGLVAGTLVAAVGAAGLIVAQRTIFPARAYGPVTWIEPSRRAAPESDQRRDHRGGANAWTRIETSRVWDSGGVTHDRPRPCSSGLAWPRWCSR